MNIFCSEVKKQKRAGYAFKLFLVMGVLMAGQLVFSSLVKAADLEISCIQPQKQCSKSNEGSLFSANDGFWYPGKNVSKTILFNNDSQTAQEIMLQGFGDDSKDDLENVLYITFTNKGADAPNWQGNLAKFYKNDKVVLGKVAPGKSLETVIGLSMDSGASPDYQNKKTSFDLTFNFWGNEVKKDPKQQLKPLKVESQKKPAEIRDDKTDNEFKGRVLGESVKETNNESWFSNLLRFIQSILSAILSFLKI